MMNEPSGDHETPPSGAQVIAERIRMAIQDHAFLAEMGLAEHISASFGISSYPDHGLVPEALIQKADQAMYRVKERDKNGIEVANRVLSGDIASSTQALRIGGNALWGEYFSGRIDEVRIYNRALTGPEILTVRSGCPPEVALPP